MKGTLFPSGQSCPFETSYSSDLESPRFGETFSVKLAEQKLRSQTLQVHVWCVTERLGEECLVSITS